MGWLGHQASWFIQYFSLCKEPLAYLTMKDMWCNIINAKYMKILPLSTWLRVAKYKTSYSSDFWRSMCPTLPCIIHEICWQVGRGNNISIGMDPTVGINNWKLSRNILVCLHERNLTVLKKAFV